LSPLTRTIVSTISSPRQIRSDSRRDRINMLRFHSHGSNCDVVRRSSLESCGRN
jgi:hypothetical protein